MTTYLDHPGGIIVCDANSCERKRRNHCTPEEREKWHAEVTGSVVRDFCPDHKPTGRPRRWNDTDNAKVWADREAYIRSRVLSRAALKGDSQ
jgi:hypothetical protein